jgi:hypothetical protein
MHTVGQLAAHGRRHGRCLNCCGCPRADPSAAVLLQAATSRAWRCPSACSPAPPLQRYTEAQSGAHADNNPAPHQVSIAARLLLLHVWLTPPARTPWAASKQRCTVYQALSTVAFRSFVASGNWAPASPAGAVDAAGGQGRAGVPVPQPHPQGALRAVHARAVGGQRSRGRRVPGAPHLRPHPGAKEGLGFTSLNPCMTHPTLYTAQRSALMIAVPASWLDRAC